MTPLHLPRGFLTELLAHARAVAPNECCGLLAGVGDVATQRFPLVNALASPTRFESSPESMFAAVRAMHSHKIEIVGVYHSHPTSRAVPSASDLECRYSDDVATVIVSLATEPPEVRGWRVVEGRFVEIELRATDPLS